MYKSNNSNNNSSEKILKQQEKSLIKEPPWEYQQISPHKLEGPEGVVGYIWRAEERSPPRRIPSTKGEIKSFSDDKELNEFIAIKLVNDFQVYWFYTYITPSMCYVSFFKFEFHIVSFLVLKFVFRSLYIETIFLLENNSAWWL